jgi:hypothetical protein
MVTARLLQHSSSRHSRAFTQEAITMQKARQRFVLFMPLAALVASLLAVPADAGQTLPPSSSRLEQLRQDVQLELRRIDEQPTIASARVRNQLEDLRDEIGYLRIMQRRGTTIQDREFRTLESRLQSIRQELRATNTRTDRPRALGRAGARDTGTRDTGLGDEEIPVDTELDVRLQQELSSETAMVEDRFEATTVVDLFQNDRLVVPAGSRLRGVVSAVDRASRTDRRGSLTVTFDQLTVGGRTYDIRATVVEALEAGISGEVGKIGAGAGIGAIIGGILGGAKGAIAGILIGAGGTVLATEGNDVDLPVGTIMRIRFDSPVRVASRGR